MAQPSRGEPISPKILNERAPAALPFGLRNATQDAQRFTTLHMTPGPTNTEFIGMTNYMSESIYDLLAETSESLSDSGSSVASHHPRTSASW